MRDHTEEKPPKEKTRRQKPQKITVRYHTEETNKQTNKQANKQTNKQKQTVEKRHSERSHGRKKHQETLSNKTNIRKQSKPNVLQQEINLPRSKT